MTVLVLQLPARARAGSETAHRDAGEWSYVFSRDMRTIELEGSATPASWPRADRVVLVARDHDVTWLSARLPRAGAGRLREALVGLLEDRLLEDTADAHLALGRAAPTEGCTWVAALNRPWLEQTIARLAEAGVVVDALVCASEPSATPMAHARMSTTGDLEVILQGPEGVVVWPAIVMGLKARAPSIEAWTVEPAAAPAVRDQLGLQPPLVSAHERLLQAAASGTNLLQLDLAPKRRASRWAWSAWAEVSQPRWRALHVGLLVLAVLQIIGLNLSAWSSRRELAALEARAVAVLQETFPSVKVVVDPLVQMQREVQTLREVDGAAGPAELEAWLDVAAGQWPAGSDPLRVVKLDAQGLVLEASGWPAPLVDSLHEHARRVGWTVNLEQGRIRLSPPSSR